MDLLLSAHKPARKSLTPGPLSPGCWLLQEAYSCVDLLLSDHKPVRALFDMRARAYDQARVESVLDTARRVVDAREMDARPK